MTQLERVVQYAQDRYGTQPEHLWTKYPDYMVLRHAASKKWYAALMNVPKQKLGLAGDGCADVLDVKCDPRMIGALLTETGFLPAYHMSKSTWISVLLDESVPDEQIFPLLELSYDSVAPKWRKP